MSPFPETPASGSPESSGTAVSAEARSDQPISLNVRALDGGVAVIVAGEVDMVTTPPLRDCVQEQIGEQPGVLVLDLSGVNFLGSSGLAVLVETLEECRAQEIGLRLVCSSREVVRPMEATGLTELFEVYSDLESAIASI
ncbi:MAG: anti-sigma factor antagonist [Pseudonocardiaceae bacterium]|nr:anti-sigma factor antagonist [Pseudonocardiaceae bacterium]